jgi:hypothetical protein
MRGHPPTAIADARVDEGPRAPFAPPLRQNTPL